MFIFNNTKYSQIISLFQKLKLIKVPITGNVFQVPEVKRTYLCIHLWNAFVFLCNYDLLTKQVNFYLLVHDIE